MEGDQVIFRYPVKEAISIHSLRMEGDLTPLSVSLTSMLFQSTPSAWRETGDWGVEEGLVFISIHSLRMEGDF